MEKQWLLKSGWVICHCGKGLTLSPSHRRLFFVLKILLSCMISYLFHMYGWWVGGCPLCCTRRWWVTKGLKWWWGRVGSRETNTLQTVVQISYSSGQMLRSVVIHQVDWPRFQCLHKSADGQFQIGQKKKTGSMAERQTHSSLTATAGQVHSTALSSTGHWECRVSNSLSVKSVWES